MYIISIIPPATTAGYPAGYRYLLVQLYLARYLVEVLVHVQNLVTTAVCVYTHTGRNLLSMYRQYCMLEQNKTRDVARPLARRDHRKPKFGLLHALQLIGI
jgi:hypothetical protein